MFAFWMGGFGSAALPAEEQTAPDAVSREISAAVADLSSEDFALRQQAEKRLLAQGVPGFEPLVATLASVNRATQPMNGRSTVMEKAPRGPVGRAGRRGVGRRVRL